MTLLYEDRKPASEEALPERMRLYMERPEGSCEAFALITRESEAAFGGRTGHAGLVKVLRFGGVENLICWAGGPTRNHCSDRC